MNLLKHKLMKLSTLLVILAIILAACNPATTQAPQSEAPATEAPLLLAAETPLPMPTNTPMPTFSPQEYEASGLGGIIWKWMRLDFMNDTTQLVDDPGKYTLQFLADGTVAGTADCNNYSGSYLVQGSSLQIFIGPMTRAACPPGSLSDEYIQRLGEVRTFVFDGGDLVLNLMMDTGNMVFSKTPVAILPTPAEGTPMAVATSNVNVRSGPSTSYPVFGVMPKGRSAEVVGKNQDGTWWVLKMNLVPQEQGWVSADFVNVTGAESVPEIEAPPLPPSAEFSQPDADDPQAAALDAFYIRSGPGIQYPAYGVTIPGQKAALIGASQDRAWFLVRVNPARVPNGAAWVPAAYIQVINSDPAALPLIVAPPVPAGISPPSPAPQAPLVIAMTSVNVRSGPGENFEILGVLQQNQAAPVVGVNAERTWWQIQVPPTVFSTGLAWISAGFVYAVNTNAVPVAAPPPPPTPEVRPTLPPPAAGGACTTLSQVPPNGTVIAAGTLFDVVWTIQNTTSGSWRQDSSDYRFGGALNGVQMHTGAHDYDFPYSVDPGAALTIVITMQAPAQAGTFGETWMITSGTTTICQFDISIVVE